MREKISKDFIIDTCKVGTLTRIGPWPSVKPSSSQLNYESSNVWFIRFTESRWSFVSDIFIKKLDDLAKKVDSLVERQKRLEKEINELKSMLEFSNAKVINIRNISFEQAKKEIAEYFEEHDGEVIDPADIQEALGIDILLAIKVCNELEKEGKIKAVDNIE